MRDATMAAMERVKLPYAGLLINGREVGERVPCDVHIEPPSYPYQHFSVVVNEEFSIEAGQTGLCEVGFFADAVGGEPIIKIYVGGNSIVPTDIVTMLPGDGYLVTD